MNKNPKKKLNKNIFQHKCGGKFEYKEKEGYVCNKCGWTKLFLTTKAF
jgi:hypothetical protein